MATRKKAAETAGRAQTDAMDTAIRLVTTATETASRLAATAADTASRLATHEAVCAERLTHIRGDFHSVRGDIKNLKNVVVWGGGLAVSAAGVIIVALSLIAWSFLKRELNLP